MFRIELRILVIVLVFAGWLGIGEAREKQTKQKGKASARVLFSHDAINPGQEFAAAVLVKIEKGWHINSSAPSDENLIATSVSVTAPTGLQVLNIRYPKSEERTFAFSDTPLDVYEDSLRILISLRSDKDVKIGKVIIPVVLEYQACNDNMCLAPADVKVDAAIRIVREGQKVSTINRELFRGNE